LDPLTADSRITSSVPTAFLLYQVIAAAIVIGLAVIAFCAGR
jgi:hypothetical protein